MAKRTKREQRRFKHKRIRYTISGTADVPRLNVFKSNTGLYAQLINDENGTTILSVSSKSLNLTGNNIKNATIVGTKIGELAKKANITKVVFDRGGYIYHGKIAALADAARKEGLKF